MPYDNLIASGVISSMAGVLVFLIWLATGDNTPNRRRAIRLGLVGSLIAAIGVGLSDWLVFAYVNDKLGAFLLGPAGILAMAAAWFAYRATYRSMGGEEEDRRIEAESEVKSLPSIEAEVRDQQGDIWCRLRDLPHMRETLSGELLNLYSADRLYWSKYKGERTIEFELGGRKNSSITGVRFETLTKYLALQEAIACRLYGTEVGQ